MTSIDEIVRELSWLMEKATPGPWEYSGVRVSGQALAKERLLQISAEADGSFAFLVYDGRQHARCHADQRLIAAARNHLPALLSALARSRRMEEALRHMLGAIDGNTIDSEEIAGDYDSGIPPHKWHEQWAYYARAALEDT